MKTIKLILALFICAISCAQMRIGDKQYFNVCIQFDPNASIKEKSPNIITELELVSYWGYVKASVQYLPNLRGTYYFDYAGSLGFNISTDTFDTFRLYSGVRLGTIFRENYKYPLFGFEAGVDWNLNEKVFIRARSTCDWREDFKFSGAKPGFRFNGSLGIGYKWN